MTLDTLHSWFGALSTGELLIIGTSAIAAGFVRGYLGFGGALIIILAVNAVIGPLSAIPIACLSGLPATLQLLPTAIRLSERAFVIPFASATFLVAPLGTLVLVSVDPALMKIAISALVLALVAMLYRGWRVPVNAGPATLAGAGALAGLVQGMAGVGGPPAVAVALARPGPPERQRANVIGAVTALALCSVLPLWFAGLLTKTIAAQSLAIVPLYTLSTWVGSRYFSGQGAQHYRGAALLALGLISGGTLCVAAYRYIEP